MSAQSDLTDLEYVRSTMLLGLTGESVLDAALAARYSSPSLAADCANAIKLAGTTGDVIKLARFYAERGRGQPVMADAPTNSQ